MDPLQNPCAAPTASTGLVSTPVQILTSGQLYLPPSGASANQITHKVFELPGSYNTLAPLTERSKKVRLLHWSKLVAGPENMLSLRESTRSAPVVLSLLQRPSGKEPPSSLSSTLSSSRLGSRNKLLGSVPIIPAPCRSKAIF